MVSVNIPKGLSTISDGTFMSCSGLTSITIPDNVISIGRCAFYGCSGLTSVTGCSGVSLIGMAAFEDTPWYENLPSGLNYIGKVAYRYEGTMPANTSIVIEDGTASIAPNAFLDCSGLSSIEIPISVISIGESAFDSCSGLTSVNIPKSVTDIDECAFDYCTSLKEIRNYSEQPQSIFAENQFYGVDKEACTLYVPTGSLSAYQAATGWADFLNIIEFETDGINSISADDVKIATTGCEITISGVSEDATVDVYSMAGQHVYSGTDKTITMPGAGAYIVRVAGVTKKVIL